MPLAGHWLLAGLLATVILPSRGLTAQEEAVWSQAQVVTPEGAALAALIDSLDVGHLWQNDLHVAWFSGLPNYADATSGVATHCSAFVSAVCERLGVYILRPPEHSQVLLANDQALWTAGDPGKSQGWTVVPDTVTAQALANRGLLVLFLRRNADPSKPGHTAVVRPHAQTNRTRVLERGPRIAQASIVNSPSTDMNLAAKTLYYYAVFQRPATGPRLAPQWTVPSSTTRYLVDAAPGGRVTALKLYYASDNTPTWRLAAGGLPSSASGAPTSSASLADTWHRLTISSSAKQEPYLTKEEGAVAFTISGGGARLAVSEGTAAPMALFRSFFLPGPANGWWYAALDDATFGLFVYSSRARPGYMSAYLLGWAADGTPTWQRFGAQWFTGMAGNAAVFKQLANCRPTPRNNADTCTSAATSRRLRFVMDAGGKNATLSGLPGQPPLALQKASVMTPVLASPPF